MKRSQLLIPALMFGLTTGVVAAHAQYGPPPPPPPQQGYGPGYGQGGPGGWETAPPEFAEAMRRGFHDGIEGARKDFENHRQPNVNNRDEYRHPPVDGADRHEYRQGFRRGYRVGVEHIYGNNSPYGPR